MQLLSLRALDGGVEDLDRVQQLHSPARALQTGGELRQAAGLAETTRSGRVERPWHPARLGAYTLGVLQVAGIVAQRQRMPHGTRLELCQHLGDILHLAAKARAFA